MTYNLVLPKGFIEMDQDEMSYVDGGAIYMSNSAMWNMYRTIGICAVGTIQTMGVSGVVGLLNAAATQIFAIFGALPGLGTFLAVIGRIWFMSQVAKLGEAFFTAAVKNKGVEIGFGFSWVFIPGITAKAK